MLQLLKERGFRAVLCIDDENAPPNIDSLEALASALVGANLRKQRRLADADNFFAEVLPILTGNAQADYEARHAEVRAWLKGKGEDELTGDRLTHAAGILLQGHTGPTHERLRRELHKAEVDLRAFSFKEWVAEGKALLDSAAENARILLLVDEVNDKEPDVDMNGQRLLSEVLATQGERLQHIDAIMVTSNCKPAEELDESQKVYEEISAILAEQGVGRSFKKVFVLSKERLDDHSFVENFEWHLNRIEASKFSIQLAEATKKILEGAVGESLDWLKRVPLLEFHHSIFVTAANEGAAEIDTLVRLATIRQRVALEKLLREDGEVQKCIEAMRKVTRTGLGAASVFPSSVVLRELREQEFERPGDHVNLLRAPLACGDVFKISLVDSGGIAREVTAMLLVNPCDLVIRQDGKRKLTTGLLVEVSKMTRTASDEKVAAEKSGPPLLYRLATGGAEDDVVYVFQNSRVESVPLSILDLCWTNSSGLAHLDPQELAKGFETLTPPQRARVENLAHRAEQDGFPRIELWGHSLLVSRTATNELEIGTAKLHWQIAYGVNRAWRLAPEYSAAALASLAQALARPAFGHDYLQQ